MLRDYPTENPSLLYIYAVDLIPGARARLNSIYKLHGWETPIEDFEIVTVVEIYDNEEETHND